MAFLAAIFFALLATASVVAVATSAAVQDSLAWTVSFGQPRYAGSAIRQTQSDIMAVSAITLMQAIDRVGAPRQDVVLTAGQYTTTKWFDGDQPHTVSLFHGSHRLLEASWDSAFCNGQGGPSWAYQPKSGGGYQSLVENTTDSMLGYYVTSGGIDYRQGDLYPGQSVWVDLVEPTGRIQLWSSSGICSQLKWDFIPVAPPVSSLAMIWTVWYGMPHPDSGGGVSYYSTSSQLVAGTALTVTRTTSAYGGLYPLTLAMQAGVLFVSSTPSHARHVMCAHWGLQSVPDFC